MLLSLGVSLSLAAQTPQPDAPLTSATCVDPAARAAFLEQEPEKHPTLIAFKRKAEERKADINARMKRLSSRARLSAKQSSALQEQWASQPEFQALYKANKAIVDSLEVEMRGLSQDISPRQACMVVLGMFAKLSEMDVIADKQRLLVEREIAAEAKKRGVSAEP